jgi:hypothetical protein
MMASQQGAKRFAITLALVALPTGCTQTLPAPEAGAFRTIATLSRDDFTQAVDREYDATISAAARGLHANRGRIAVNGCGSQDQEDCTVTYTENGFSTPLVKAAPNARALMGGIANYGGRMAELAEAPDLEELRAKAEAASGAAKALALAALPAGPLAGLAGPIIDAGFWAANTRRVDRRRHALLDIALATQPSIDQAAATLTTMSVPLRDTPIQVMASQLNQTKNEIAFSQNEERAVRRRAGSMRSGRDAARLTARADQLRDRRDAAFTSLIRQQEELNALRAPGLDYRKLADAHRTLIKKLRDPHVSIENAVRDLDFLVATAGAVGAATHTQPAAK